MSADRQHARAIAGLCVREARAFLGAGWGEVSPRLRRGLVDSRILLVILAQDESTSAEAILRYLRDLSQAADDLLKQEGDVK
jgi:uncharacterized protein (UPF0262 family)